MSGGRRSGRFLRLRIRRLSELESSPSWRDRSPLGHEEDDDDDEDQHPNRSFLSSLAANGDGSSDSEYSIVADRSSSINPVSNAGEDPEPNDLSDSNDSNVADVGDFSDEEEGSDSDVSNFSIAAEHGGSVYPHEEAADSDAFSDFDDPDLADLGNISDSDVDNVAVPRGGDSSDSDDSQGENWPNCSMVQCTERFRDPVEMDRHCWRHMPWLSCTNESCTFGTRHPDRLEQHMRLHITKRADCFRCNECIWLFFTCLKEVERHLRTAHNGPMRECKHCMEEFADPERHLRMAHREAYRAEELHHHDDPQHFCQICLQTLHGFSHYSSKYHRDMHDVKRLFKCPYCCEEIVITGANAKAKINEHFATRHRRLSRPYIMSYVKCNVCPAETFFKGQELPKHLIQHFSDERLIETSQPHQQSETIVSSSEEEEQVPQENLDDPQPSTSGLQASVRKIINKSAIKQEAATIKEEDITLKEIKQLPELEKSLAEALDAQRDVSSKKKRVDTLTQDIRKQEWKVYDLRKQIRKKEQELKRQTEELKRQKEEKKNLTLDISSIETGPNYKNEEWIGARMEEVHKKKAAAKSMREALCPDGDHVDKSCPICFETPREIYSCIECENWLCGKCIAKLETCPICRVEFAAEKPRRNKTVERLFGLPN